MKVVLYQEGEWHCSPDIIRIFRTLELTKKHIPEGYEFVDIQSQGYAENTQDERWLTITEYQVIE